MPRDGDLDFCRVPSVATGGVDLACCHDGGASFFPHVPHAPYLSLERPSVHDAVRADEIIFAASSVGWKKSNRPPGVYCPAQHNYTSISNWYCCRQQFTAVLFDDDEVERRWYSPRVIQRESTQGQDEHAGLRTNGKHLISSCLFFFLFVICSLTIM